MPDRDFHFTTVALPGESQYREKGSRFLAWALPVRSEAEVKAHIARFWQEHPDACHVCYAYLLKKDKGEGRAQDDGEPSGTAGRPILNQILSSGYEDVLVAVVRYYGGVKLGTGGLVQAYKTVARDALADAQTVTVEPAGTAAVVFPFSLEGKVNALIKKYRMEIGERRFTERCRLTLHIPLSVYPEALEELKALHGAVVETD